MGFGFLSFRGKRGIWYHKPRFFAHNFNYLILYFTPHFLIEPELFEPAIKILAQVIEQTGDLSKVMMEGLRSRPYYSRAEIFRQFVILCFVTYLLSSGPEIRNEAQNDKSKTSAGRFLPRCTTEIFCFKSVKK